MPSTANALTQQNSDAIRGRLIQREKSLIAKTAEMLTALKAQGGLGTWTYQAIVRHARERLEALNAGLVPVRIGGRFFPLRALLGEGQYVPPAIVAKASEAAQRFPSAEQRVYGWEREALPEVRRRRDPVLTMRYGEVEFFLGFWLEAEIPDAQSPEFIGITMPLLPKPGRGRPRKLPL